MVGALARETKRLPIGPRALPAHPTTKQQTTFLRHLSRTEGHADWRDGFPTERCFAGPSPTTNGTSDPGPNACSGSTASATLCKASHASGFWPVRFQTCVLPTGTRILQWVICWAELCNVPTLCGQNTRRPGKHTTSRSGQFSLNTCCSTQKRRGMRASSSLTLNGTTSARRIFFKEMERLKSILLKKHCLRGFEGEGGEEL